MTGKAIVTTFFRIVLICVCCQVTAADDTLHDTYFKSGMLPICSVEFLNVTIRHKDLDSVHLFFMIGKSYKMFKLKHCFKLANYPNFDMNLKTVVFAHGFTQNATGCSAIRISKCYREKGDYNVLMLDARDLLSLDYISSVTAVRMIGNLLGQQIYSLYQLGFNISTLELIGHSLGAHIMGFAGKTFHQLSGVKIPKIVGLDPAGPCYRMVPSERRLHLTDAEYVQVIHTNGGYFGLMKPLGHIDFYLNGGRLQPANAFEIPNIFCSHDRAVDIWYSVISNPGKFIGVKCTNIYEIDAGRCKGDSRVTIFMGWEADMKVRGLFYMKTLSDWPYYLEENGIKSQGIFPIPFLLNIFKNL